MPSSPPKRPLTFAEKLGVGVAVFKTLLLTTTAALTSPFLGSKRASTFTRHVVFALTRALTASFSPKALVTITPSTDAMYQKFATSVEQTPDTVILADGTRGHWIGDSSAEKVIVYFHGGGYLMHAVNGHFQLLSQAISEAKESGTSLAALLLAYDVSFDAPYPRQLQQATALLDHLLHTLNRPASDIILAGDSAGGNLAIAVLSHILHPHPNVAPLTVSGPFAGVALLSPWVTFNTTDAASMKKNQYKDVLAGPVLDNWAAIFQGSAPTDHYLEPLSAPQEWWSGLPIEDVLITAGADEIFVDDIQSFGNKLQAAVPKTSVVTTHQEIHDHLVMEFDLKEPASQQRQALQKWICARVAK
ncbi:hypothetical protein FE257_004428 [Aspergillus nanangensis]|uniref:Alpha/beta hydrolase fold-3 domain-containing protein n=1 Tax=Aspergillus nanangensis TaxID=2582783 RepID=A0AAD4GZ83_ASPNN|nr:hypothetical protein FE257_004428 [Aspergillus nanangensis]